MIIKPVKPFQVSYLLVVPVIFHQVPKTDTLGKIVSQKSFSEQIKFKNRSLTVTK